MEDSRSASFRKRPSLSASGCEGETRARESNFWFDFIASAAPPVFALAKSSTADEGFGRAAFGGGEASCTVVETDGGGGGGACFVAIWTWFKLGGDSGWFSCSAIHTSKPAARAPAGASHCQRVRLKRRALRDFLGGAAWAARGLWLGAAAAGDASRPRAVITGRDSFTMRTFSSSAACSEISSVVSR